MMYYIEELVKELKTYLENQKEKDKYKTVIAEYLGEDREVRPAKREFEPCKHMIHKHDHVMMHIYSPQKITFSLPDDYMWGILFYDHSFLDEWKVLIS